MNRDLAGEVVERTWPSDALKYFVDGYILALEDVLKNYKTYEAQGLVTEGFVDTLIEDVQVALGEAKDTLGILMDTKLLDRTDAGTMS